MGGGDGGMESFFYGSDPNDEGEDASSASSSSDDNEYNEGNDQMSRSIHKPAFERQTSELDSPRSTTGRRLSALSSFSNKTRSHLDSDSVHQNESAAHTDTLRPRVSRKACARHHL